MMMDNNRTFWDSIDGLAVSDLSDGDHGGRPQAFICLFLATSIRQVDSPERPLLFQFESMDSNLLSSSRS